MMTKAKFNLDSEGLLKIVLRINEGVKLKPLDIHVPRGTRQIDECINIP